jgi:hypothetical protein
MTKIIRVVAAAAVSIAASLPALAEETKAATEAQPAGVSGVLLSGVF